MRQQPSNRKTGWMRGLVTLVAAAAAATAFAQPAAYPDKARPIRIIVPSGAASVVDLLARAYAKSLTDTSGLNVVVENKPGAELVIGVQALVAAPPDGYTIMVTSSSSQVLNPVMLNNLPYDPLKDMVPVSGISKGGLVMNLGTSTTFHNARELIAAARANPGKYTCASASTTTRLACELLQATAGVKILNVPYKTTAAAVTAVASGEADMIFVDVGSARGHWQTGRVRGVAVTQATRMPTLPTMPTLKEEGATDYDLTAWYAAYAPNKTSPEVLAALREAMRKAGTTKLIADTLVNFSMEPLELTGDALVAHNRREIDMWSRVVRAQGIKSN